MSLHKTPWYVICGVRDVASDSGLNDFALVSLFLLEIAGRSGILGQNAESVGKWNRVRPAHTCVCVRIQNRED